MGGGGCGLTVMSLVNSILYHTTMNEMGIARITAEKYLRRVAAVA